MTNYSPPTEDLPIFDSTVFLSGDEPLTYNQAVKKFLKYPNAQGTENLQAINVSGVTTLSAELILSPTTDIQWDRTDFNYLINSSLPKTITTGTANIALGHNTLDAITTGSNNIMVGRGAGTVLTTAQNNVGIGTFALNDNISGSFNICVGGGSGRHITSGIQNIGIGQNTLNGVTTSNNNVAIGAESLKTTTDDYNVGIGTAALRDSTVASECISIGYQSNMTTTAGIENTALGSYSDNGGFSTSTCIGYRSANTANNQIRLGRATETVSCPGTLTFKMSDDNTNGSYYIPFSKVAAGTEAALFIDSVTSPLTYNPSTGRMTALEFSAATFNNSVVNTAVNFGTSTSSGTVNIGTSLSSGSMNIATGLTTGNITIGPSSSGSPSSNVTIMARGGWTGTFQVGGNSASASILMAAPFQCNYPINTSNTTAPTASRMLGYTTTKTTGWSNITNAASNINSITIDGVTIAFGVYRIEAFINFTNGAATQDFRIGVSTTSATLQAPLCVRSTASGLDDGVLVSQTISAYATTTFYIVAQSSNAVGATLYTSGVRNSTINLTRIG